MNECPNSEITHFIIPQEPSFAMSKQKARSTSKNRDNSMTSEESTETVTTSNSQANQEVQDPSTELEARIRGYIDVAIRASTESIWTNKHEHNMNGTDNLWKQ
ncbi:hypothetical protein F8M41_019752 [Gigaspora margarita]|uniref:Uncharacterized protein n=1 Tax=Gigaspora margarita TaxID=4874 RepID=A0A8H4ETY5_GIGMA|nr:hypothetical protein F8M41_019752 [Gigaspora margarita]